MTEWNAEAVESIKRLKARYFRTMDTKDWAGFRELFAPDAVMDMSGAGGSVSADAVIEGADRVTRAVSRFLAEATSVHHGHCPEIELVSATAANGIWSMEDRLWFPDRVEHGFGHYHDTYTRDGDRWLIAETRLVRLRGEAKGEA